METGNLGKPETIQCIILMPKSQGKNWLSLQWFSFVLFYAHYPVPSAPGERLKRRIGVSSRGVLPAEKYGTRPMPQTTARRFVWSLSRRKLLMALFRQIKQPFSVMSVLRNYCGLALRTSIEEYHVNFAEPQEGATCQRRNE